MVTYNYSLTPSLSSIQQVINQIVSELSTNPDITDDITISLDAGNYAGFTIPTGGLFPLFGSQYRLIIKSAGDFFPIIDFNYSSPSQIVGIDIGSGNPNVTIKNIRVQYFAIGIRSGLNSHYPIVRNCIVNNNRNVGILFEQSSQSQAIQNIIINGDYGIVCRLTKSAAIIHNTIFQNGAISTTPGKSISCIWAELANDYGGGISQTGVLHLIGNIAWNTSGRCLTLFGKDIDSPGAIVSNFNDWVKGDPEEFISIEDNAFYQGADSEPRQILTNLTQWKSIGFDPNSISQDPKFISPVKIRTGKNGFAVDLNLLPVSPVLGLVPSFAFNNTLTSQWLPSYVDSSTLATDILRKNRSQSTTAAGSNEKVSTSGFFGQDVFSNPLDLDIAKQCGIDPFSNVLFKSLDLWYPKLKRGYFYSNEREFYLYSKKKTKTFGEIAITKFYLPGTIVHNREITIRVAGKVISQEYFDIVKDQLYLYHMDLEINSGQEEIEVVGWISNWNGDSFVYNKVLYRLKIKEGETRYLLPSDYVPVGPVVVTDDRSFPTDSDVISNREFCVVFDPFFERSEIILANNSNLVENSQFDYAASGETPLNWDSYNCTVIGANEPHYSVAGDKLVKIEDRGYIKTTLPINTGDPFSLSFHAMSYGSGDISWTIEFYDAAHNILGMVVTGSTQINSSWNRYAISFNSSGQDFELDTPQVPFPCTYLTGYQAPTRSHLMTVQLSHIYSPAFTGDLLLDAIQYENSINPTLYHRKVYFNEMTVEYESGEDDYFIDTKLSMSPVTNLISDGFLCIPEIPAAIYGGPYSPAITTLHEWRWPLGRKRVMPWARTKGKDKLRKRPKGRFNLLPEPKPEIISPVSSYAIASNIKLVPTIPTCTAGDENGVGLIIKITDTDGNPFALGDVYVSVSDYNLRYPGTLSKRLYGLKQQLGASIRAQTDNAGVLPLIWIPPDDSAGTYRGEIPSPSFVSTNNERISIIDTEYPVTLESQGNITILDNKGVQIPTHASSPVTEMYIPSFGENSSTARLRYPAKPGSVNVIVNNTRYTEANINILDSNQFYVDYNNSLVTVKGRVTNIYIEYIPSYVFINESNPYKIMLYYDKLFPNYSNSIVLSYDFSIKLDVYVSNPGNVSYINNSFELVAQNSLFKKATHFNSLALEF